MGNHHGLLKAVQQWDSKPCTTVTHRCCDSEREARLERFVNLLRALWTMLLVLPGRIRQRVVQIDQAKLVCGIGASEC